MQEKPFNFDIFAGLAPQVKQTLFDLGQMVQKQRGQFYFLESEPAQYCYLVQSGQVKLLQTSQEGKQVTLRLAHPGQIFGGLSAWRGANYPLSAQSFTASQVLRWPGKTMIDFMLQHPQLLLNGLVFVSEKLLEIQNRYRDLATEQAAVRIARTLRFLARQTGIATQKSIRIDMPLTRQDLAEMTGTTLFTVSRTLSAWESEGILDIGRERVIILDMTALETKCNPHD